MSHTGFFMRLLLHVGFFIRLIWGSTSLRIPFASLRLEEHLTWDLGERGCGSRVEASGVGVYG